LIDGYAGKFAGAAGVWVFLGGLLFGVIPARGEFGFKPSLSAGAGLRFGVFFMIGRGCCLRFGVPAACVTAD
jgi:hypothetical protein